MAVNIESVAQVGLLSHHYPPPLFPKPGKENVRLRKILKRTAKKKAASQASQTAVSFRSSLSPVNEASPDLEHSDHSTPPKTPESLVYGSILHPRFNVRPLYHHSPSPYPHQRGMTYGQPSRVSPQPCVTPGSTAPHHMAVLFPYPTSPRPAGGSPVPSYAATSVTVTSVITTTQIIRPTATKSGAGQASVVVKHTNNVLATKMDANSSLTPIVLSSKRASPQPTIFDSIKPSKPIFDVPQITNYTCSTANIYFASSPTMPRSRTPLSELMRGPTPTFEVRRIVTPTSELKRDKTPTREIIKSTTPTFEVKRGVTPTSEIKRGVTPTSELKRGATPTSEIKGEETYTPEIKKGTTPISEATRGTLPGFELKSATTETSEIKRDFLVLTETKRGRTPTRGRTSTSEASTSKTLSGRPKTPSYHVSPVRIPIIEISRANPLLFAVSPVHMEGRRSKTPTSGLVGSNDEIPKETEKLKENNLPEAIQNGEVHIKSSEISEATMPEYREPELLTPHTPVCESPKPITPTSGYQRPKTPNHDVTKPEVSLPGYQRPKVPPFAGQRPRTPTSKSKWSYYGLTPAEYVAHGGIQAHTPAFGISRSTSAVSVESKPLDQEAQGATQNTQSEATEKPTSTEVDGHEKKPTARPRAPAGEITASIENGMPVVVPTFEVSKLTTPIAEPKLKLAQEASREPTSDVKEKKKKVAGVPEVKIPTIVVSKADTPPSKSPKTEITIPETKRTSQTPTYSPLKTKTPPPDSVIETTKSETSVKAPDQKAERPTLSKETTISTKINKVSNKPSEPQMSLLERIKQQKSSSVSPAKASEIAATAKTEDKPLVKPQDDQVDKEKTGKEDSAGAKVSNLQETESAVEKQDASLPAAKPLLKVIPKPKGMKSKLSGWSRLKKHMVVEVEEPKFPEAEPEMMKDAPNGTPHEKSIEKSPSKETNEISDFFQSEESKDTPRAAKMWDAILFQMFSTKESIMQQLEANKTEEEKTEDAKLNKPKEIPTFAHRLPVLLYSPRFDARRLKEAASRPVTKIAAVFEMGLIGRKSKDEEPKDFNRTAKGFTVKTSSGD
ncbi:protein piccolo [Electrophorus electricus]|uniref:Proline rich 33 n=1 Tax=Electrophorus electricus TaxID=8005 RepID=A0A4W4ETJ3_ELEEL|nr:protein piccolo [Electrophorus electricus]